MVIQQQLHFARVRASAMEILAALGNALEQAPADTAEWDELVARRVMIAAEILNAGTADPATVQTAGGFTDFEMKQVRAAAEEFCRDDAALDREIASRRRRGGTA